MAFDDLILESVQSVTKAATSLISAATEAQKVLVAQGKMSGSAKKVKAIKYVGNLLYPAHPIRARRTANGPKA